MSRNKRFQLVSEGVNRKNSTKWWWQLVRGAATATESIISINIRL